MYLDVVLELKTVVTRIAYPVTCQDYISLVHQDSDRPCTVTIAKLNDNDKVILPSGKNSILRTLQAYTLF